MIKESLVLLHEDTKYSLQPFYLIGQFPTVAPHTSTMDLVGFKETVPVYRSESTAVHSSEKSSYSDINKVEKKLIGKSILLKGDKMLKVNKNLSIPLVKVLPKNVQLKNMKIIKLSDMNKMKIVKPLMKPKHQPLLLPKPAPEKPKAPAVTNPPKPQSVINAYAKNISSSEIIDFIADSKVNSFKISKIQKRYIPFGLGKTPMPTICKPSPPPKVETFRKYYKVESKGTNTDPVPVKVHQENFCQTDSSTEKPQKSFKDQESQTETPPEQNLIIIDGPSSKAICSKDDVNEIWLPDPMDLVIGEYGTQSNEVKDNLDMVDAIISNEQSEEVAKLDLNLGDSLLELPNINGILFSDIYMQYDLLNVDPSLSTNETGLKSSFSYNMYKYYKSCDKYEDGNLPIHVAVEKNDVRELSKQCAILKLKRKTIDMVNFDKLTPLQLAVINDSSTDIIDILLKNQARLSALDTDGNSVIHLCVLHSTEECLIKLLQVAKETDFDVNCFNYDGVTPLMLCTFNSKYNLAEALLSYEGDPDVRDQKSGRTALFHAVESDDIRMVKLLLDNGADTKICNFFGTNCRDAVFELDTAIKKDIHKMIFVKSEPKRYVRAHKENPKKKRKV